MVLTLAKWTGASVTVAKRAGLTVTAAMWANTDNLGRRGKDRLSVLAHIARCGPHHRAKDQA